MIATTLNRIRAHAPCDLGWENLLSGLGKTAADDEPLPFARIVEINDLDDALWCCRAEPQHAREWRLFAVWCARLVQRPLTDPRSIAAINVAERYANGHATKEELTVAAADAALAIWNADSTRDALSAWDEDAALASVVVNAAHGAWLAALAGKWAAHGVQDVQTAKFLEIVS